MDSHELVGVKLFFSQVTPLEMILFVGPFALLLACLAVLPLFLDHFWESNKNKAVVALTLGFPSALFFLFKDWHMLTHTALDYAAFVSLMGALFVISGGIYVRGAFAGLPWVNGLFLLIGALLANHTIGSARGELNGQESLAKTRSPWYVRKMDWQNPTIMIKIWKSSQKNQRAFNQD